MKRAATAIAAILTATALGAGVYAAGNRQTANTLTVTPSSPATTTTVAAPFAPPVNNAIPARAAAPADRIGTSVPDTTAQRIELNRPANAVCVTTPAATPAEELNNLMTGQYGPLGDWLGADIGGNIQIGDATQWAFFLGDSMYAPNNGVTMPARTAKWGHNSALIQDGHCYWIESTGGSDRSLIEAPAGNFYWPQDGYVHNGKLYLALIEGRSTGAGGLFGFETFDTDLAVFTLPSLQNPTIIETGPWDNTPLGYLDIFAADTTNGERIIPINSHNPSYPGVYLARITDPAAPEMPWQWWNGTGWDLDPVNATDVATRMTGDNAAIRPFHLNGKWVAMAWSWTMAGITTRINIADKVTGPYVETSRAPITALPGQAAPGIQYWHTLEGTYPAGDGLILGQWANNGSEMPTAGSPLAHIRPTFVSVDASTLVPAD